jgi:hypothetical protein
MAITKGDRLRIKNMFSTSTPMVKMWEASGQTFGPGDLLIQASGAVSIAATSTAANVVGIAMTSGQNHATDNVATGQMIPMAPGILLEVPIAGAANATLSLDSSHMFHGGHLKRATQGAWYMDLGSATTSAGFRVVGLRDATGTVHGVVYVRPTTLGSDPMWKG